MNGGYGKQPLIAGLKLRGRALFDFLNGAICVGDTAYAARRSPKGLNRGHELPDESSGLAATWTGREKQIARAIDRASLLVRQANYADRSHLTASQM